MLPVASGRLSVNVPEDDEPFAIVTEAVTEVPPVWASVTVSRTGRHRVPNWSTRPTWAVRNRPFPPGASGLAVQLVLPAGAVRRRVVGPFALPTVTLLNTRPAAAAGVTVTFWVSDRPPGADTVMVGLPASWSP